MTCIYSMGKKVLVQHIICGMKVRNHAMTDTSHITLGLIRRNFISWDITCLPFVWFFISIGIYDHSTVKPFCKDHT